MIGEAEKKFDRIEKFKKKLSELDLCVFRSVPARVEKHYDNKILKKILFQYINKGSYNVALLEILLRKNYLLKFALSLVSKAILFKRNLIQFYEANASTYIEMRVCGDYFNVLDTIKVTDKEI